MSKIDLIPKKLYRYQPDSELARKSLAATAIWYADPEKFNDPYDCALDVLTNQLRYETSKRSREECINFAKGIFGDEWPEHRTKFESLELPMLRFAISHTIIIPLVESFRGFFGVCSFSDNPSNLLMWGHYADKHSGFCLEFDSSYEPFPNARRVVYSDLFPSVDLSEIFRGEIPQIVKLLLAKAECWDYENEWRLVSAGADRSVTFETGALTGIYFGALMKPDARKRLVDLTDRSQTALYSMHLERLRFSLKAEPYSPSD